MEKTELFSKCSNSSPAQPASHSIGIRGFRGSPFPPGYKGLGVKLTVHFYLVLRSRMNGVLPLLPHVFMVFM